MSHKIPLMKNCRVDTFTMQDKTYSCLVDYSDNGNDRVIYFESGYKKIKELYSEFSYIVRAELSIDNFHFYPYPHPFKKINGLRYSY